MFRILAVLLLFMASYASAQQTTGPVQVANPPGIAVTNGQGINTTLITPNIGVVTGGDVSAATASGTLLSAVAGQAASALPAATAASTYVRIDGSVPLTSGLSVNGDRTTPCGVVSIGDATGRRTGPTCTTAATWVGLQDGGLNYYFDQYALTASWLGSAHGFALAGAARTYDNTGVVIALGGYGLVSSGTSGPAWGAYIHCDQIGTGSCLMEHDVGSLVAPVAVNPYQMGLSGTTSTAWLGAGGELCQQSSAVGCTNIGTAIGIVANGNSQNPTYFVQGLTIGANAIAGDDGTTGTAPAIVMAKGHEILWRYQNTTGRGAFIRSDATGSGTGMILGTNTLNFVRQAAESTPVVSIGGAVAGQVNGVQLDGAATGSGVDIQAIGTDASIPIAIQPKGTSGWFALNIRDGTSTGGFGRGNKAVDLQMSRDTAPQVASGAFSFTSGRANTASGDRAIAMGESNTAVADHSIATGFGATTRTNYGSNCYASGVFSKAGDSQICDYVLRASTTDATPTVATSNQSALAATNTAGLPLSGTYKFAGEIVARNTANGDSATWAISGAIKTLGTVASTAFVGTPTVTKDFANSGAASWSASVSADTTYGAIDITVTGAAVPIQWVVHIHTTETAQ